MAQMQKLDCSRGAPMGRHSYGNPAHDPDEKLQLFKVRLDNGGYDDGSAYWGIRPRGTSLYCLQGADCQQFYDAHSRKDAFLKAFKQFGMFLLKNPIPHDRRYTLTPGKAHNNGVVSDVYHVLFCDELLGTVPRSMLNAKEFIYNDLVTRLGY